MCKFYKIYASTKVDALTIKMLRLFIQLKNNKY